VLRRTAFSRATSGEELRLRHRDLDPFGSPGRRLERGCDIQPCSRSTASGAGTTSGQRWARDATIAASWRVAEALALKKMGPRSVGTRRTVDHGRPKRASASASSSRRSATSPAGSTSCRCTRGSRRTWPVPRRISWHSARPTCGWPCCRRGTRRCSTSSTPSTGSRPQTGTIAPACPPLARQTRCAGCATPSRGWRRCARSWPATGSPRRSSTTTSTTAPSTPATAAT
jgi:hypothetical protein